MIRLKKQYRWINKMRNLKKMNPKHDYEKGNEEQNGILKSIYRLYEII